MKRLLFYLFLLFPLLLVAQRLEDGVKLYKSENYAAADKVFAKLLARTPHNAQLNYWRGATLYQQHQYTQAAPYLLKAYQTKVTEAFPLLVEAYLAELMYAQAVEVIRAHLAALPDGDERLLWEKKLSRAQLGQQLIVGIEQVEVIDSIVVDKNAFLQAYKLSSEAGKLDTYARFFDSTITQPGTVYLTQRGDKVFYAEEMPDKTTSLFSRNRLVDGSWSEADPLPVPINDAFSQNYPFLLSDGTTIYYATNNPANSLGGYDMMVTRINVSSGEYLKPVNLGFPFNSPYNDYMMAIDEEVGVGWFASDRYQPASKVCVYLFLYTEQPEAYQELTPAQLHTLAKLTRIGDTQRKERDYSSYFQAIKQIETTKEQQKEPRITFVLNNNLTLTDLSQFFSPQARSYYEQSVEVTRRLSAAKIRLEELYLRYRQNKEDDLVTEIQQLESAIAPLYAQPEELQRKARNAELTHRLQYPNTQQP